MAFALRTLTPFAAIAPIAVLWGLPLAGGLGAALAVLPNISAWTALIAHPQLWPALALSLWTGTASTLASLFCALLVLAALHGRPRRVMGLTGWALAIPHLAFAIGFGFLIMPAGLLARLFHATPPLWVTVSDPLGLSLIASLVLKETPFLIWIGSALLARADAAERMAGEWRSAHSLAHGGLSIWLRVVLPQLLPRLLWPVIAVWVYGATVVDMALVIGPTEPPALAVLIWSDLNHAEAAINDRGAAGALFLTLALGLSAAAAFVLYAFAASAIRAFLISGPWPRPLPRMPGYGLLIFFAVIYCAVILLLAIMSVAGHWPFPGLLPEVFTGRAWLRLVSDFHPLAASLALACSTAAGALVLAVVWFECVSARLDRIVIAAAVVALGLPVILIATGQYRLFLQAGLTGSAAGLFVVHLTPVFAYVFLLLKAPYRAFDRRFRSVSLGLNANAWRFWLRVKAPLLRAPLAAAAAIGFAVSMAQFVSAQLIGAGRYATLPMEAVTLSSGGNRALTAAYALAMAVPPAMVFLASTIAGKQRWR